MILNIYYTNLAQDRFMWWAHEIKVLFKVEVFGNRSDFQLIKRVFSA